MQWGSRFSCTVVGLSNSHPWTGQWSKVQSNSTLWSLVLQRPGTLYYFYYIEAFARHRLFRCGMCHTMVDPAWFYLAGESAKYVHPVDCTWTLNLHCWRSFSINPFIVDVCPTWWMDLLEFSVRMYRCGPNASAPHTQESIKYLDWIDAECSIFIFI